MDDATPRPAGGRRFGLLDAMILVGSAALGFAGVQAIGPGPGWVEILRGLVEKFAWNRDFFADAVPYVVVFIATPPAMAATVGVLVLGVRKPRPRWRRLRRQPGFVSGLAVVLSWAFALLIAAEWVLVMEGGSFDPMDLVGCFLVVAMILGGFVVIVAWSGQALYGRWRPEPTWLDRLGRLVGAAWIALASLGGFALVAF